MDALGRGWPKQLEEEGIGGEHQSSSLTQTLIACFGITVSLSSQKKKSAQDRLSFKSSQDRMHFKSAQDRLSLKSSQDRMHFKSAQDRLS